MKDIGLKILRGAVSLVGKLPLGFHYACADFISWMLKDVLRYRNDVVYTNLARSFPEKKYKDLKKIADEYYDHMAEIIVEAIWFGASDYKRLRKSGIITVTNPEVLNEYFEASPSTTILFSHCGNWEMLGGLLGYRTLSGEKIRIEEKQIKVVYKRQRGEVADMFFRLNRVAPLENAGIDDCEVESESVLRYSISHRNERFAYIYIADQCPYKFAAKHPIGDFLNQQTNAMLGSAGLACKLAHSVVYLKMKRIERGKYEMTFIPISRNASESTPEEIMRKYFDILEEEIKETPANWLWSHRRWK